MDRFDNFPPNYNFQMQNLFKEDFQWNFPNLKKPKYYEDINEARIKLFWVLKHHPIFSRIPKQVKIYLIKLDYETHFECWKKKEFRVGLLSTHKPIDGCIVDVKVLECTTKKGRRLITDKNIDFVVGKNQVTKGKFFFFFFFFFD